MNAPNEHEFTVPINDNSEGMVIILWPCDGMVLQTYLLKRFNLDPGDRSAWAGKCYMSQDLDEILGRPSVVMALQIWELNLKSPARWETNSHLLALLAHECFHAAEWMLKQTGSAPPNPAEASEWQPWEDAAHLLQRIMRRALEGMISDSSSKQASESDDVATS